MRRSPLAALAAVAYAVILADLLTKLFAVSFVGGGPLEVVEGVRLGLVYNDGGAFGLPARELGIEASTVFTFGLILLTLRVCRELTAVDARAPLMLGLIVGAGAANHIDMLASPRGVSDFIALEIGALDGIVFNFADLALLAGLVLCARTAALIVTRIVQERGARPALAGGVTASLDRASSTFAQGRVSRTERSMVNGDVNEARPTQGGRANGIPSLLALPGRFDRAATPALVIACTFILLYSLAIVWLPDAGRSAPSALLLALGVFGTVFVAVYAEMALAERREMRAAARAEREVGRMVVAHGRVGAAGLERTIFDGSLPQGDETSDSAGEWRRDRRDDSGDAPTLGR